LRKFSRSSNKEGKRRAPIDPKGRKALAVSFSFTLANGRFSKSKSLFKTERTTKSKSWVCQKNFIPKSARFLYFS